MIMDLHDSSSKSPLIVNFRETSRKFLSISYPTWAPRTFTRNAGSAVQKAGGKLEASSLTCFNSPTLRIQSDKKYSRKKNCKIKQNLWNACMHWGWSAYWAWHPRAHHVNQTIQSAASLVMTRDQNPQIYDVTPIGKSRAPCQHQTHHEYPTVIM